MNAEEMVAWLKDRGVSRRSPAGRALLQAAEAGLITEPRCAMETCFYPKELGGEWHFERIQPQPEWIPTADHKKRKRDEGLLTPDNVRLAHRICNRIGAVEADGHEAKRDRSKVAALVAALRESADAIESLADPDLGEIPSLFALQTEGWNLDRVEQGLRFGARGTVSGNGWHVQYVVREDDAGVFLEFYATNRFVWGDLRKKIYADGHVLEDLPTLEPIIVIKEGEDEGEARRRYQERNRRIADELAQAGLL